MPLVTRKYLHDVGQGSNLDLILRGFNGAVNRFADQVGGGLRAIALALSTPQDNSTQVQAELDKVQQKLKAQTDALESAVKTQQLK